MEEDEKGERSLVIVSIFLLLRRPLIALSHTHTHHQYTSLVSYLSRSVAHHHFVYDYTFKSPLRIKTRITRSTFIC